MITFALWIIFGIIVGLIATVSSSNRSKDNLYGLVFLGILGSVLGGFLGNLIFIGRTTDFSISSFFQVSLFSILLVALDRTFSKR